MRQIKNIILLSIVFLIVGCGELDEPKENSVEGGTLIVDIEKNALRNILKLGGQEIDDKTEIFGYKAYKINYTTTDEEGNSVQASGLMSVPKGMGEIVEKQLGFSLISDDHGTIFANIDAPTVLPSIKALPSGSSVILTAFGGFVTLQPDYIGFGDSNKHYHPFILKKSLANSTVDFIKVARKFAQKNSIKLNGQLFLTGYSEGGYAAMATLQKIETDDVLKDELKVTMAAPMAGPYALESMAEQVLLTPTLSVPSFMANIGYAYARAYEEDLTSIINEPYATSLEKLFNGDLNRTLIDPELTTTTKGEGENGLFVASFTNEFLVDKNATKNWFRKAIRENDIHQWSPSSPLRLVHCMGDDVIPFAISQFTERTMKTINPTGNIALVPVEVALTKDVNTTQRFKHAECGPVAYQVTLGLFAKERKEKIGY